MLPKTLRIWALLLASVGARAAPFTFGGDSYRMDFESKKTFLSGHARVEYQDQIMQADSVVIDDEKHAVRAEGNVHVQKGDLTVKSEAADIDLLTGFGTFYNGVLKMGVSLYVEGKEIESYAKDRYRVVRGKVSRCQDCPQSWSVTGAHMDIEIEGFVEVHHALIQVKDVPIAYLPAYILPIKTKRQSGFLFPRYQKLRDLGSGLSIPYFRVLSDNADTTFDYLYTVNPTYGGHRLGNEVRYLHSDRTMIDSYQSILANGQRRRGGFAVFEKTQLSPHWAQRLRSEWASDSLYSYHFENDFPSTRLPSLETEASLSWQSRNLFAYGSVRLPQDNLPRNSAFLHPQASQLQNGVYVIEDKEDGKLVGVRNYTPSEGALYALPELVFVAPSFHLFGPVRAEVENRYLSLRRSGPLTDPETGWIREGDRFTSIVRLAAPQNVWSYFYWKPVLELRGDVYRFPGDADPNASRARYFLDQTFGTTFSRVWATERDELKALKHTLEPYVRWTYADHDLTSGHRFFRQTFGPADARVYAPQFDLFDPVTNAPPSTTGVFGTANEEQRLRAHHLLTLAAFTRVIGRYGEGPNRRYETHFEGNVGQDFDLYARDDMGRPSLGPFRLEAAGYYGGARLHSSFLVNWRATENRFNYGNDASYFWRRYRVGIVKSFDNGSDYYGANGGIGNLGPWSFSAEYLIQHPKNALQSLTQQKYQVDYSGSDSLCWWFNVSFGKPYGATQFTQDFNIGILLAESGKKTTVDSLMNQRRRSF